MPHKPVFIGGSCPVDDVRERPVSMDLYDSNGSNSVARARSERTYCAAPFPQRRIEARFPVITRRRGRLMKGLEIRTRVLTVAILTALASSGALATSPGSEPSSVYGAPATGRKPDETIHLGPHSRWVNVDFRDTVRFVAQDSDGREQSFTWWFNVSSWVVDSFELSEVAPATFPYRKVRVYVESDAPGNARSR
jgi:hypothetical protein